MRSRLRIIISQVNLGKIKDNVLHRDFLATKPNQQWATDITEFKVESTSNGSDGNHAGRNGKTYQKLYLSPIIDLFTAEIISYTIKERPTYDLVQDMLDDALNKFSQAN